MSAELDDTPHLMVGQRPVNPTVLIVDDDELVLARLRELVAAAGYVVHTATGGVEAISALEDSFASIVITDLSMPDMDGLDLCRRVRQHAWPGYIYILVLTARNEEKDILAGLGAGADDYLSKQTAAVQFVARLQTAKRILTLEHSLKNLIEQNLRLAMTDTLTGMFNRRYLMRHMSRELKRAQRFGGELSLLLLDVDHFKRINDTYGHEVGDAVLRSFSRIVRNSLRRETDWCARLGGEEFVVILEGTDLTGAGAFAEQLRQTIQETPIVTSGGAVRITVSIGISGLEDTVEGNSASVESLLKIADIHLYTSKHGGRNRVTVSRAIGTCRVALQPSVGHANGGKSTASVSSVR